MKFRCIDVETTGLPSDDGAEGAVASGMMQAGWCDYVPGAPIVGPESVLVDCGIPVSIEARAVHHISDEMVAGEINPTEACRRIAAGDHTHMVAHNTDHEKHYVGAGVGPDGEERQWLCTYKTSLRLWPDAPGHKLSELRYFLDLDSADDFDPKLCSMPHRAPDDAYVCAHLVRRILRHVEELQDKTINLDRLVKWSTGPALLVMCWMKKHKGKTWRQVAYDDRPYLEWIYDKSDVKDRDIRATVKYWLNQTATK